MIKRNELLDLAGPNDNITNAIRRDGHWLSHGRAWKRKQRKHIQAALNFGNHLAHDPKDVWMPRASRGWRRHVRKVKANGEKL